MHCNIGKVETVLKLHNYIHNSCCYLIVDLQDTTLALDFRVTVLEENGGGDGNSSVAELEARVETLEGTAADHETRISATESDVTGNSIYMIEMNVSNQKRT